MGRKSNFAVIVVSLFLFFGQDALADTIFINEIHYDNAGTDVGEGIEIAGTAGCDLSGFEVVFYNGGNGDVYGSTLALSGTLPDQQNGFGVLAFQQSGLQNGPDGIALMDSAGTVVQFLSYEGAFTAVAGPAMGMTTLDIGAGESAGTEIGFSLQLSGVGGEYADFQWNPPQGNSLGQINFFQEFTAVPLPSAMILLMPGLAALSALRPRKNKA